MTTRSIDLNDSSSIEIGIAIIEKIIYDTELLIKNYNLNTNELNRLNYFLRELKVIYHKYSGIELICFKIMNRLGNKKIKNQMEYDFLKCFDIEEEISKITSNIWHSEMSNPDQFTNGDRFKFIVHASKGFINLPGTPNYRKDDKSHLCCSLITDNHIAVAKGKVCLALDVDNNNFICASYDDCTTVEKNQEQFSELDKIKCVKIKGNNMVVTYGCSKYNPITKTVLPMTIEANSVKNCCNLNNKSRKLHNEVLLDNSNLKVRAIIIISNGCDILFEQYKIALEMQRLYNVNIKVINSSLYREKAGLPKYEKWEYELWNQMLDKYNSDYALDYLRKMDIEDINVFLDKYYEEIVMEGHYDQMIKEQLENTIEHLRNLSKQY